VAEVERFQGFLSYAHLDAEIDPKLVAALTTRLEKRVTRKLINAHFAIWRDGASLRTGERWDERIGDAVRASQVFIVLMTPKWFESAYCRKEYQIFAQVEQELGRWTGVTDYVVPLLAHTIEKQIRHLKQDQRQTYDDLNSRQYKKVIAADFLALTEGQEEAHIDDIADDIEGMIERLRYRSSPSGRAYRPPTPRQAKRAYEFGALEDVNYRATIGHNWPPEVRPLNFSDVDYVSLAEILVEPRKGHEPRGVFARLSFVERLYVTTNTARVEFSVRLAYLSLSDAGAGKLARNPEWERFLTSGSVCYVHYKADPEAITICIGPEPGQTGLSALPLPPAGTEKFLSMLAIAAPDTDINRVHAHLRVSFRADDLFVVGEDSRKPSAALGRKIAAIIGVLAGKKERLEQSRLSYRNIPVRERT
jgi:hypothetical protein